MKNKKGFTLVELLSVIVLISLLLGIGIPGISKISENMKKRSLNTKIKLIEDAGVFWGQDNKTLLQTDLNCNTADGEVPCKKISVYGLISEDYLDSENYNEIVYDNPTNNESMLNNCVYIYKKNNRVHAMYKKNIDEGEVCNPEASKETTTSTTTKPIAQNPYIIYNESNPNCTKYIPLDGNYTEIEYLPDEPFSQVAYEGDPDYDSKCIHIIGDKNKVENYVTYINGSKSGQKCIPGEFCNFIIVLTFSDSQTGESITTETETIVEYESLSYNYDTTIIDVKAIAYHGEYNAGHTYSHWLAIAELEKILKEQNKLGIEVNCQFNEPVLTGDNKGSCYDEMSEVIYLDVKCSDINNKIATYTLPIENVYYSPILCPEDYE